MAATPASGAVSASERLYRLLLVAYPRRFRREYGESMAQVFRDCCRAAERGQGLRGVLWLWLATLRDLARTAFVERITEALHMSDRGWIRWSGLAAMLAGVLWIAGLVGLDEQLPWVSHAGGHMILAACAVFLLFGVVGAYARYGGRAGVPGKSGLALALLGALLVTVGNALEGLYEIELGWGLFMLGIMCLLLGMVVFSVAVLRGRLLPQWSVWPFVVCAASLVPMLVTSMVFSINLEQAAFVNVVALIALFAFGLGWMALGYALWSGTHEAAAPPPLAAA